LVASGVVRAVQEQERRLLHWVASAGLPACVYIILTPTGTHRYSSGDVTSGWYGSGTAGWYGMERINQKAQTKPMFRSPQNSKFFHSLSITSIFSRLYGVLNVGKKNI
jgi:hypothetical protein